MINHNSNRSLIQVPSLFLNLKVLLLSFASACSTSLLFPVILCIIVPCVVVVSFAAVVVIEGDEEAALRRQKIREKLKSRQEQEKEQVENPIPAASGGIAYEENVEQEAPELSLSSAASLQIRLKGILRGVPVGQAEAPSARALVQEEEEEEGEEREPVATGATRATSTFPRPVSLL